VTEDTAVSWDTWLDDSGDTWVIDTDTDTDLPFVSNLYFGTFDAVNETVEVWLTSDVLVAGFQFHVLDAEVLSGAGGAAEASGLDVYASGTNTALSFSFAGTTIPPDLAGQLLTTLSLQNIVSSDLCLANPFYQTLEVEPCRSLWDLVSLFRNRRPHRIRSSMSSVLCQPPMSVFWRSPTRIPRRR
jgi:hypothetical protein